MPIIVQICQHEPHPSTACNSALPLPISSAITALLPFIIPAASLAYSTFFASETAVSTLALSHVRRPPPSPLVPWGDLPLKPALSGSTCASLTLPSSTTRAYRLERGCPKMAVPSKAKSSALVKAACGSPRKRICHKINISQITTIEDG